MVMCWVPGCNHYNIRETCKFFVFPKAEREKQKWLKLIRRADVPGVGARVCSCHFRDGKKENGPEIFERNIGKLFGKHHLTPEKKKGHKKGLSKATIQQSSTPEPEPEPSTSMCEVVTTSEFLEGVTPLDTPSDSGTTSQTPEWSTTVSSVALEAENFLLKTEIAKLQDRLRSLSLRFTYEHIAHSDKLVLIYTGLPSAHIFESLCLLLQNVPITYYLQWKVVNMDRRDQILMTLMKLRQNFPHDDLALRFNVSQATVTNIIITFVHVLYETVYKQLLKNIPSRHKNKSCLPNCFSTFTNCRLIIDCTEIISVVPRHSMTSQRATYSSYKHHNTWKGLVGVAPNGVITYVSKLYPGSTSDKKIVEICGVLEQLVAGDLILADKGFLIQDLLPAGVNLNIPPFLTSPQFTKEQIYHTRVIAKARIHVERAIRRMKVFKILNFIPQSLFPFGSIIFNTVAALTNLQYPLIKEVEQLYGED